MKCLICNKNCHNKKSLAQHIRFAHKIRILDYQLKFSIVHPQQLFCKKCNVKLNTINTYNLCYECYQKSSDRKLVSAKIVANRPSYDGEDNPNYRGTQVLTCPCGVNFNRRISPSQVGKRVHLYCSTKCKKQFSISKQKRVEYKGIVFRSSWEAAFAQYLDFKKYNWKFEPQSFKTSVGFYTPDFWVEEFNSYVEIKGYFRDENSKTKFQEFAKIYPVILGDLKYLKSLGFSRITSGPEKGQLCLPAAQP